MTAAKLLVIDACECVRHIAREGLIDVLRPGDLVVANELRDLHRAQNAERVAYRNVKYIFRRKKIEAMLPVAGWAKRDEHFVAASLQVAA